MHFQIPVVLVCFAIICGLIHYKKMKASSADKRMSDEYWELQDKANHTRNKPFTDLEYFTASPDEIPKAGESIEEIKYCLDKVDHAISQPMMNLSDYSNTDLKLAYGTGNFEKLSLYDDNFNSFLVYLSNLANAYYRNNMKSEAQKTFMYAIKSGSTRFDDWMTLAKIYKSDQDTSGLNSLKELLSTREFTSKNSLLDEFNKM